jgi:hypothetical protein
MKLQKCALNFKNKYNILFIIFPLKIFRTHKMVINLLIIQKYLTCDSKTLIYFFLLLKAFWAKQTVNKLNKWQKFVTFLLCDTINYMNIFDRTTSEKYGNLSTMTDAALLIFCSLIVLTVYLNINESISFVLLSIKKWSPAKKITLLFVISVQAIPKSKIQFYRKK